MKENELFEVQDYDNNNYNHKNDPYFDEKVGHEAHKIMGLLRFTPDENGVFIAKCAPEYFILPEISGYFSARFKDTPWEIIDEKRGVKLLSRPGKKPELIRTDEINTSENENPEQPDEWEELWKHYHKIINNESRNNPKLQKQLMPERYWKYLPEIS